jgi:hypothetical protein
MQGAEVQPMVAHWQAEQRSRRRTCRNPAMQLRIADLHLGTGDFGPLRRCSSLQGTYLAADSAPGIDLEIDPSQTP